MRVAIIGSGIAGMSCAWLLNQAYEITLYEADDRLGGHSHTVLMPTAEGAIPVDTGFIVYNEPNYPNLTALFDYLNVPTKASTMSFGVSLDNGRFEYSGSDSNATLFAQKSNLLRPGFYRMLAEIIRFNGAAARYLMQENTQKSLTVGEFLDRGRYGSAFCEHYLLPMSAAIWSASLERIRAFPAQSFFQFFDNHGLISVNNRPPWRTVDGGSRVYVERLTKPFRERARLNMGVQRIKRLNEQVEVHDIEGGVEVYDAVVLACHADQALALIEAPSGNEREILGAFDYQENETILHSDPGLMPRRKAVWSSWNYLASSQNSGDAKASVTYWLNHLQSLSSDRLALVSLNPIREPDPSSIVARFSYAHPQFDHGTLLAQERLHEIQGRDRLWFAGAHWGHGFHEDGLLSGLRVAAGLGVTPPWWSNVAPLMSKTPDEPRLPEKPVRSVVGGD